MKKIINFLINKTTIIVALLILQIAILTTLIFYFNHNFTYIYSIFWFIGLIGALTLINKYEVTEIKLTWISFILIFPIFGILLYLILANPKFNKKDRIILKEINSLSKKTLSEKEDNYLKLEKENCLISSQSKYIYNTSNYPLFENTSTKYLELGEVKFRELKKELLSAEKFIFIQYFIISEGRMWSEILDILVQKVKDGVDVRVMYDDFGSMYTLPKNYYQILIKKGIKCVAINPLRPSLNIVMQNRDHRKIVVIDGHTGFTGGINLGDEYINELKIHGHWKDCAVLIKGEAVFSLTVMFLETWNFYNKKIENYNNFKSIIDLKDKFKNEGYVQPYSDSPLDSEYIGQQIYTNIITQSKKYVYINTPYFIVDYSVLSTFINAAKRGIDVRIVTPGVADKWYVHLVTRSYYKKLIESGVKVYEYKKGFIHSKTFVSDDDVATIGTVNLDYRSLYHHFECGVWMYKTKAVTELKKDYEEMLKECKLITLDDCKKEAWYKKLFVAFIKIITPLM